MVDDVDDAIDFYTNHFGFESAPAPRPRSPTSSAATCGCCSAAPELGRTAHGRRRTPRPGGWNRIHFIVDDLDAEVERLRAAGVPFRNDVVSGPGGQQILPRTRPVTSIELFQPAGT